MRAGVVACRSRGVVIVTSRVVGHRDADLFKRVGGPVFIVFTLAVLATAGLIFYLLRGDKES